VIGYSGAKGSLGKIRSVIDEFGYEVLELNNPLICDITIGEDEQQRKIGIETARFAEMFSKSSGRSRYMDDMFYMNHQSTLSFTPVNGGWGDAVSISFLELDELRCSGVDPEFAYKRIVDDGLTPGALMTARQDGVETSLMSGAL
jgi:hypothetical protein